MSKSIRLWAAFFICLLLCLCCAAAAYALDIDGGGTYDISKARSEININTTEPVTLTGKLSGTIACTVEAVTLTLNGAKVTSDEGCALSFTGAGNVLILEGKNTIHSGGNAAGVRVEQGTELTIRGDGSLMVTGGGNGAGIGGGDCAHGGTLTIESGEITAVGVGNGAGIGGGSCRDGGDVTISGGTVTATGGEEGAGIGRGTETKLRSITISGGVVEVYGGRYAAGIGGGKDTNSCDTTISGGSMVYAQRGEDAHYDIGAGEGGHNNEGWFTLRDGAAVFLGSNRSATPVAGNHTKKRPGNKTDPMILRPYGGESLIYGIAGTGESPWAEAKGGYFVLRTVHYDNNGSNGALPDPGPVHRTEPVTAAIPDGLSKEGYTFTCWNTQANLRGRTYFPGDVLLFPEGETELTLYAQWDKE